MALNLNKALKAFSREDTARVDCGGGWTVEIKQYSSVLGLFSKEQARLRSQGVLKERNVDGIKKLPSVSLAGSKISVDGQEEDSYLLGSIENDIRFFVDNVLVGWEGLKDDDGADVPFSKDNAYEIMTEQGEAGHQLYRELFSSSMDSTLFIKSVSEQAKEDAKN